MIVDLVRVTTADGVRLDGALRLPAGSSNSRDELGLDACLMVHGTGSNFYGSTLLETIADSLHGLGLAVLSINTRGHDSVSVAAVNGGPRRFGAAYETLSDCTHDLAAWCQFLMSRGSIAIALIGHSSGAVKSLYAAATVELPGLQSIVAISPPHLSYSRFQQGPQAADFERTLSEARAVVARGEGQQLMDVKFPLPYLITAAGFVEKYGPDERYNILRFVDRLPCPTLCTFGSLEVRDHVAFSSLPEALEEQARQGAVLRTEIVAGADHFYAGCRSELSSRVVWWLRKMQGTRKAASG